jgi:hypothetical protein
MIRPALAFALFAFAATPVFAAEIACDGVFNPNATADDFVKAYGKHNVVTGEVDGPEGTTMIATTVFGDDPNKSFQVYWWDEDKYARVAGFTVPADSTGPGGVKVGMGIDEVQKLNGEPFTLSGFWWDYGGSAGFQTGKLSELPGGCYMSLQFEPSVEELDQSVSDAISGDRELTSDQKEMAIAKPVVTQINLGFPDADAPAD